MGISRGTLKLIAITLGNKKLSGNVLTFGTMEIDGAYEDVVAAAAGTGLQLANVPDLQIHPIRPDFRGRPRLHQNAVFELLGFSSIEGVDYRPVDGPTHLLDLNNPLPESFHNGFDLVYDGGTTEHCFNAPQVFANVVAALKPGGMVMHHLPMNRAIDHGFYQFSPTTFFDFYEANGFDEMEMKLHFTVPERECYVTYDPRRDRPLPFSFGYEEVYIFFSARKRTSLPNVVFPMQARYTRGTVRANDQAKPGFSFKRLRSTLLNKLFPTWYPRHRQYNHYLIDKRRWHRRVNKLKRTAIPLT
jgi:hypothetical protein